MLNKKRLILNAGSSVVQIAVSGITLFILYKYLLKIIGAETLGIWALVLSASSLVQFANLGITGSIVKHIADYEAVGDRGKMSLATQTAIFTIGILSALIIAAVLPFAHYYFEFALEPHLVASASNILPIALLCFWISMITGVYQGALYGSHLIAERNYILMFDSVSHLALCLYLASDYGLIGLAYARLLQNGVSLVVTVFLLKRSLPELPIIPHRWNKNLFKEIFSYAVNFQVITLLVMLFDPVTKGFLSRYGSVSYVSYYEMANKLIQLVRSIVVNVNNVLVPSFAKLQQTDPDKVDVLYNKSYQVVFYLSIPVFGFLIVGSPLTSVLWVGEYNSVFVLAMVLLSFGWLANTVSVPTYFLGMGIGNMRLNVMSHVAMTLFNIVFILLIGKLLDGKGVVVASAMAIGFGGVILNLVYFYTKNISWSEFIPGESRLLVVSFLVGISICACIFLFGRGSIEQIQEVTAISEKTLGLLLPLSTILLFVLFLIIPAWKHPIRKMLFTLLVSKK